MNSLIAVPIPVIVGQRPEILPRSRLPPVLVDIPTFNPDCNTSCTKPQQKDNHLTFALLNSRSVCNKKALIENYIVSNDIDALFITESWLPSNQEYSDKITREIVPTGYTFHKCSRINRSGGGILIIFKEILTLREEKSKTYSSFQCLKCTFKFKNVHQTITTIYRPSTSDKNPPPGVFFDEFVSFLADETLDNKNYMMLGDFNMHVDDPTNSTALNFLDILEQFNFVQHVNEPTHEKGHTLDLVITRKDDRSILDINVETSHISDHHTVFISLAPKKPRFHTKKVKYRKSKSICRETFSTDIRNTGITKLVEDAGTVSEKLSVLNETIGKVLDKHAPMIEKSITLRPNTKWFNEDIRKRKHERRKAEKLWRKTKLTVHKEMYQKVKNDTNYAIEEAKRNYVKSTLNDNGKSRHEVLKTVNGLLKNNPSQVPLPTHNDKIELSERFNQYFVTKIDNIRQDLDQSSSSSPGSINPFTDDRNVFSSPNYSQFEPVSIDEIVEIVKTAPNKSCPLDTIPTWLIKEFIDDLAPAITSIVNCSLERSDFPSTLKDAIVKPLLKKPTLDKENLKNYRPVSNLSFISKITEKVVATRIQNYLKQYDLHDPFQSAYRHGYSTKTALLRINNDIITYLDANQNVILLLLDLSSAFDTVDHCILKERLCDIGIDGAIIQWIDSYLSGRQQSVQVGDKTSSPVPLRFGVPQGSILGPLLFTIYLSPLQRIFEKHQLDYHIYADDTQVYIPTSSTTSEIDIHRLENCARDIKSWMIANKLQLNETKTELIIFHKKNADVVTDEIEVVNSSISKSSPVRNLGVFVDELLEMTAHINKTIQSCYFHIRNIGRIRNLLGNDITMQLVQMLVHSRLDYCNSLLVGLPEKSLGKLQKVQNTAARLVSRTKKRDHITPVLKSLHWLPINARIRFKTACLAYKCINADAPEYLRALVRIHQPPRALRSASSISLERPMSRTNFTDRAFSNAAPRIWNSLSTTTRNSSSFPSFKKNLKTELFRDSYL